MKMSNTIFNEDTTHSQHGKFTSTIINHLRVRKLEFSCFMSLKELLKILRPPTSEANLFLTVFTSENRNSNVHVFLNCNNHLLVIELL